jgi:S-adenosylmethionine hydrolase
MTPSGVITLLTDFGLRDPYVGIMKGVILSIHPQVHLVDISHEVRPGDIVDGALVLQEAYSYFPPGTVHLVVVDPGVGGARRPMVLATQTYFFIGPDNGVFSLIIRNHPEAKAHHLTERRFFLPDISRTFHGRDIFAPAAAHLSSGVEPARLGCSFTDPTVVDIPAPRVRGSVLYGTVLRTDRFGNVITNISRADLKAFLQGRKPRIRMGDHLIEGMVGCYAEVERGTLVGLIGSCGCLEIAMSMGRASEHLRSDSEKIEGTEVSVRRGEPSEDLDR